MALHDEDTGRGASLEAVLAELKRGKTVPCYLLCGEEEFRLRDALEKITAALIPDAGDREFNLFVTDGEREDVGSLCESLCPGGGGFHAIFGADGAVFGRPPGRRLAEDR
jgi:hypothetical protein